MKKIKLLFLVILFISASKASFALTSPGTAYLLYDTTYTSKNYHVSISFPANYTEEAADGETETIQISTEFNNELYMLALTRHTIVLDDPEGLAKVSLTAFSEEVGAQILNQRLFTYQEHKGIQAVLFLAEQKTYMHYKVILIDSVQYQLVFMTDKKELSKSAQNFFSSFKILP